jgi:hypothetical protein
MAERGGSVDKTQRDQASAMLKLLRQCLSQEDPDQAVKDLCQYSANFSSAIEVGLVALREFMKLKSASESGSKELAGEATAVKTPSGEQEQVQMFDSRRQVIGLGDWPTAVIRVLGLRGDPGRQKQVSEATDFLQTVRFRGKSSLIALQIKTIFPEHVVFVEKEKWLRIYNADARACSGAFGWKVVKYGDTGQCFTGIPLFNHKQILAKFEQEYRGYILVRIWNKSPAGVDRKVTHIYTP